MSFAGGAVGPDGQAAAGGSPPEDRGRGEDKVAALARMARAPAASPLTAAAGDGVDAGLAPLLAGLGVARGQQGGESRSSLLFLPPRGGRGEVWVRRPRRATGASAWRARRRLLAATRVSRAWEGWARRRRAGPSAMATAELSELQSYNGSRSVQEGCSVCPCPGRKAQPDKVAGAFVGTPPDLEGQHGRLEQDRTTSRIGRSSSSGW